MPGWASILRDQATRGAGRPIVPGDGIPEADLARAERRLAVTLPASHREYLRLAGNLEINRSFNPILLPDELRIEDDRLIFMEENQDVVTWGFLVAELAQEDPVVWQRVNDSRQWDSEEKTFSAFLAYYFDWIIDGRA